MKFRLALCFLVLLAVVANYANADQVAITKDGREVVLKDDGTWEYVEKDEEKAKSTFHFRKIRWGMTQEEVEKSETWEMRGSSDLYGGYEILSYSGSVAGIECILGYDFTEERLVQAGYFFTDEHTNENRYIDDYKTIKRKLTKKYNTPVYDNIDWSSDLYKDNPSKWGRAVSKGDLSYSARWETSNTKINLMLSGNNYKVFTVLMYYSKALKELRDRVEDKKTAEEF